jgi:hypothetical protein
VLYIFYLVQSFPFPISFSSNLLSFPISSSPSRIGQTCLSFYHFALCFIIHLHYLIIHFILPCPIFSPFPFPPLHLGLDKLVHLHYLIIHFILPCPIFSPFPFPPLHLGLDKLAYHSIILLYASLSISTIS